MTTTYEILRIDGNENVWRVGNAGTEIEAIEMAAAVGGWYSKRESIAVD